MEEFAFDGAAVVRFPDGAGAVGAYGFAGCVDEGGFGCLKDPLRSRGGLLAGVDLNAFAGDGEDGVLRGWWSGGVLGEHGGCHGERRGKKQAKIDSMRHRLQFTPIRFDEFG